MKKRIQYVATLCIISILMLPITSFAMQKQDNARSDIGCLQNFDCQFKNAIDKNKLFSKETRKEIYASKIKKENRTRERNSKNISFDKANKIEIPAEVKIAIPEEPITTQNLTNRVSEPNLPVTDNEVGDYEKQVADLVNKERIAQGLQPLTYNENLSKVAESKAADMRDKAYFSHTSPTYGSPFDMMSAFGIDFRAAGENIAKGYKTPSSVMEGWMNSPGHKANILSTNFTEIGVGYVTDSSGTAYWVQMFIHP